MTEKIYDSKAEAMKAAEKLQDMIDCVSDGRTEKNALIVYIDNGKGGHLDIARFKYKAAPKAGTRGYGWNGDRARPLAAPIYVTTGEFDRNGRPRVMGALGDSISIDNFEPIETDTELETALGRIADWLNEDETPIACKNMCCSDCLGRDRCLEDDKAECRAAQIANLLEIARGEG